MGGQPYGQLKYRNVNGKLFAAASQPSGAWRESEETPVAQCFPCHYVSSAPFMTEGANP
jgi:hypothetical protein